MLAFLLNDIHIISLLLQSLVLFPLLLRGVIPNFIAWFSNEYLILDTKLRQFSCKPVCLSLILLICVLCIENKFWNLFLYEVFDSDILSYHCNICSNCKNLATKEEFFLFNSVPIHCPSCFYIMAILFEHTYGSVKCEMVAIIGWAKTGISLRTSNVTLQKYISLGDKLSCSAIAEKSIKCNYHQVVKHSIISGISSLLIINLFPLLFPFIYQTMLNFLP